MIKIRNSIIYLFVCIIVLSSFKLPEILLNLENDNIAMEIYKSVGNTSKIDVDAEKIYLVKAIHDIEEGKTIEISSPKNQYLIFEKANNSNNFYLEMQKLKEYTILKNINLSEDSKTTVGIINKNYKINNQTYTVNHIILNYGSTNQYLLNIENKTGKIIYLAFDKENAYDAEGKKEMLENYIKYLNLYIIDDWKYNIDETNKVYNMDSQKAQLRVSLLENSENFIFSVHIISNFKVIDTK